ncbi:MAG TPA: AraC family transcriptional regulator, partial [Methylobacterium sp.]
MSALIGRLYAPAKIEPIQGGGRVRISAAHGVLPGIRLARTEAPEGMRVLPQDPYDAVGFMAPFSGHIESHERRGTFAADAGAAIAVDGLTCRLLRYSPDFGNHAVGIERALIARRLTTLLDRPVSTEVMFAPQTDARSSRSRALASLLAWVTDPTFGLVLGRCPFTAARIPAMVVDFLLETWPHSCSAEFRREPPLIAPRAVKAAIDFIEAHPTTAASAEEVAALCGVSLRALQYGFRRFAGVSITEYQRRVRLQRARSDLLASPDS